MRSIQELFAEMGPSESRVPAESGDYYGEDGLLRCGTCGGRKEYLFSLNGHYVPCACGCEQEKRRLEEERRKREREIDAVKRMASYSLMDDKFYASTFDAFTCQTDQDRRILSLCRRYVENFDRAVEENTGLFFYGPPGTGKTFAASCIANALMERRISVLATSIVRLTADAFGDGLNETLGRMNQARLLVLDDFGAERNTDFKVEQIFTVIDARYAAGKPMILTSNLSDFKNEDDIRRLRIYDRIFEVCIPVRMEGVSRRKTAGTANRRRSGRWLYGNDSGSRAEAW